MFAEEQLGNPHAKVWVVSSQPKKGEVSPMSSQTSAWFMTFLYAHDLEVGDIRFEYLVNDIGHKGGLEVFLASGQLKASVGSLKDRINKYKPNIVLCLGADCLYWLLEQRDLSKWRGHVMPFPFSDVKCLFTYEPVAAHQQRFVNNTQNPGQYQTLMKFDIKKAMDARHSPALNHYDMQLTVCTEYGKTVSILQDMLENSRIISFDIEVIKPYEGRLIDCMSLSDERNINLCIPFWRSVNDGDEKNFEIDRMFPEHELAHIWSLVKQLLGSNIPKVAQNSQYDITTFEVHYDIAVCNLVWDTMVAAHNIFCELPKDLGTLISLYTNIPYHKFLIHSGSTTDRWLYSAADSGANLHVMSGQRAEMAELDGVCGSCEREFEKCLFCKKVERSTIYQHYVTTTNPLIRHCVDMHKEGVRIEPLLRDFMLHIEHEYQERLKQALHKVIPWKLSGKKDVYNLNPKSPQQLNKLFYEYFGCKTRRTNGKRSMDDAARQHIMEHDPRKEVVLICKAVDNYIYSDASLLKFKVEPEVRSNGQQYIRTKYDPSGTDTGRLASKASDVVGSGTNLQNNQKGPQREMIIPEEGEEFMHVDLYAAEAFLNFLDAGELDGLRMISGLLPEQEGKFPYTEVFGCRVMTKKVSDKLKIHNWMFDWIIENYPEEAEKSNLKYKDAKQIIHASNYNVQAPMMAKESGLPLNVCQAILNMYHGKYPGIRDRMERIEKQLKRTTCMETSFHRRRYFFADINKSLFNVAYAWPNQSTIGEVTNTAMCTLRTWSEREGRVMCKPVLNTHDGLIPRVVVGNREQAILQVLRAFNIPLKLRGLTIRIPVSIGFGPNFNDCFDEKVYFYDLEI